MENLMSPEMVEVMLRDHPWLMAYFASVLIAKVVSVFFPSTTKNPVVNKIMKFLNVWAWNILKARNKDDREVKEFKWSEKL